MSFSVSTDAHSAADIRSAIEHVEPTAHLSDRQLALLRAGKAQAIATLDAGDVGDATETSDLYFTASINGNANGTSPQVGDSLTVAVGIAPPPE